MYSVHTCICTSVPLYFWACTLYVSHVRILIVLPSTQQFVLSCGLVVDVSVTGIKKTITLRSSMQVSWFVRKPPTICIT